jgi:uncharacterized protein with HEPN domain
MSKHSDFVPMGDMLDLCDRIAEKMHGIEKEQFDADENLRVTVMHFIQTIGEAARRVSEEGRKAHPRVECGNRRNAQQACSRLHEHRLRCGLEGCDCRCSKPRS